MKHAQGTAQSIGESGSRFEYHLTDKGEALLPVLTTLREWSDEWVFGCGNEPLVVNERGTGKRVPKLKLRNAEGQLLRRRDLRSKPGPGASPETRSRLSERRSG